MVIYIKDRFENIKYKEETKTFDTNASLTTVPTNDWTEAVETRGTTVVVGSIGWQTSGTTSTSPFYIRYNRGGMGFSRAIDFTTGQSGSTKSIASRFTSPDLMAMGRRYISFSYELFTFARQWNSTVSNGYQYGNCKIWLIDDVTNLQSNASGQGTIADFPSGATSNYYLLGYTYGEYVSSLVTWGRTGGHITLDLSVDNQITVYHNNLGFASYGGTISNQINGYAYSAVNDSTVINTTGWSDNLYIYIKPMAAFTQPGPGTGYMRPSFFISPVYGSNRPLGGLGSF